VTYVEDLSSPAYKTLLAAYSKGCEWAHFEWEKLQNVLGSEM